MENKILFYQTESGEMPAKDFIDSLQMKDQAKMSRCIDMLQELGPFLKEPHKSPVENGIYELRSKVSTNIQRVLFFHYENGVYVLLNGFTKKTDKIPPRELAKAEKYRKDFLRRVK